MFRAWADTNSRPFRLRLPPLDGLLRRGGVFRGHWVPPLAGQGGGLNFGDPPDLAAAAGRARAGAPRCGLKGPQSGPGEWFGTAI